MIGTHRLRRAAGIAAAVVLLLTAAGVQYVRERRYPASFDEQEALYVTSGDTVRRLSVGYQALAADLYWIRAIQYYGETTRRVREAMISRTSSAAGGGSAGASAPDNAPVSDFQLLYPMLDITTALDPQFNIAYRFGSIFLAENYPTGAGRPDLAIKLLEKALAAQPDKWEYMQDIGFVHYWWRHDYVKAAEWFNRAADVPGSPWFLRSLAATTMAVGGDRQSSRTIWESIRQTTDNEWLRGEADRRLQQLSAMDFIDEAQRRADRYAAQTGQAPRDWTALGVRSVPPLDPTGTPFELRDGRVSLSPSSRLSPLPDEPRASKPQ